MKPGLRYALIAIFFLAFLVLAPFVVSFVTGVKYDSSTHSFVRTGSIYAKTQPKNAQIFLNGRPAGTTPATLRFLAPGDYQILISKNGYFDWSKTLNVRAQYVTYVNQDLDYLTMFFTQPRQTKIADNVLDFYSGKKKILYITADSIFLANIDAPQRRQQLRLPGNFSALNILAAADENYYLIYNDSFYAVFDARNNKLFDLSKLISALSPAGSANGKLLEFSDRDDLFFLAKNILYQLNWENNAETAVAQNVFAYQVSNGSIYFLTPDQSGGTLQLRQSGLGLKQAANVLISGLPDFSAARIFLNNRNQPFLLGDGIFYSIEGVGKAADSLRRITDSVNSVELNDQYNKFLLANNNEIDIYDYFKGNFSSVTRSGAQIKNPLLLGNLGWVLYLSDGALQAIELDNRNFQNNYRLAAASLNAKFSINPDLDQVFLLDQGKLVQLGIR